MVDELTGSSHAYLQLLADSCESERRLAGEEQAMALSLCNNLRLQANELNLEPIQARMVGDILLQTNSTCSSLLLPLSALAREQLAICVMFEDDMKTLNVTTSLEENWRDAADQQDQARSRYVKLQQLCLQGLLYSQGQLVVAITEADARLRSFRALASLPRTHLQGLSVDPFGGLEEVFHSLRSVAQACNEAFAAHQAESAVVVEEDWIAFLRGLLHACKTEIPTAQSELELESRLHANRKEAARLLCEVTCLNTNLNTNLKATRRQRNMARYEMDEAIDELPFGDRERQQKEDMYNVLLQSTRCLLMLAMRIWALWSISALGQLAEGLLQVHHQREHRRTNLAP
jgi:hypothetical protein